MIESAMLQILQETVSRNAALMTPHPGPLISSGLRSPARQVGMDEQMTRICSWPVNELVERLS
jgi:hypothetical protein